MDNRGVERLATRKSPTFEVGDRHVLYRSESTISEYGAIDLKNRSHTIEADIVVTDTPAEGVLLSMGGGYGGFALFVHEGRLVYVHNYVMFDEYTVTSTDLVKSGRSKVSYRFQKTGEHCGLGQLLIDGKIVGEGEIPRTIPYSFAGVPMAIGHNPNFSVSRLYRGAGKFAFNGTIDRITIHAEPREGEIDRKEIERIAIATQ